MEVENHARRNPWSVGETPHEHAAQWAPTGEDPRRNNLKVLKGHRGDKLIGEAAKVKQQLMKWIREDEKAKAWACIHAVIMSFIGILFFLSEVMVWFYPWRRYLWLSIALFLVFLVVLPALIIYYGMRKKDKRQWIILMGFLCIVVALIGIIFGFFMYYKHLVYYLRYKEMRSYSNVAGGEAPSQFGDGSMFLFTQYTRLDVMRSVGFKSKWDGNTYCVAPVVDSDMTNADEINFWAVGENCCLARGEFICEDAEDPTTMSALVVLEPTDVVRPMMQWAVAGSVFPKFENAIKLQESAYATRSAQEPKLLYWVKDPISKQDSFYYTAKNITIWTTVLLWVFLLFTCYIICYKWRWIRPRNDKRMDPAEQSLQAQAAEGATTYGLVAG
jgi:hypothetical protein